MPSTQRPPPNSKPPHPPFTDMTQSVEAQIYTCFFARANIHVGGGNRTAPCSFCQRCAVCCIEHVNFIDMMRSVEAWICTCFFTVSHSRAPIAEMVATMAFFSVTMATRARPKPYVTLFIFIIHGTNGCCLPPLFLSPSIHVVAHILLCTHTLLFAHGVVIAHNFYCARCRSCLVLLSLFTYLLISPRLVLFTALAY